MKRGLSAGIENYLLKPLNEQELKETLIQIEKKQMTDSVIPRKKRITSYGTTRFGVG